MNTPTTSTVWICLGKAEAVRLATIARRGVRCEQDAEAVEVVLAQLDAQTGHIG